MDSKHMTYARTSKCKTSKSKERKKSCKSISSTSSGSFVVKNPLNNSEENACDLEKEKNSGSKIWKNLSNVFGKPDVVEDKVVTLDTKNKTLKRLTSLFKTRRNSAHKIVPMSAIGISPRGYKAVLSHTELNRINESGLAMAVKLPSGATTKILDVTVELEAISSDAESSTSERKDKANIDLKCCEETESKTVFVGKMRVSSSTNLTELTKLPLFVVDSQDRLVINPDIKIHSNKSSFARSRTTSETRSLGVDKQNSQSQTSYKAHCVFTQNKDAFTASDPVERILQIEKPSGKNITLVNNVTTQCSVCPMLNKGIDVQESLYLPLIQKNLDYINSLNASERKILFLQPNLDLASNSKETCMSKSISTSTSTNFSFGSDFSYPNISLMVKNAVPNNSPESTSYVEDQHIRQKHYFSTPHSKYSSLNAKELEDGYFNYDKVNRLKHDYYKEFSKTATSKYFNVSTNTDLMDFDTNIDSKDSYFTPLNSLPRIEIDKTLMLLQSAQEKLLAFVHSDKRIHCRRTKKTPKKLDVCSNEYVKDKLDALHLENKQVSYVECHGNPFKNLTIPCTSVSADNFDYEEYKTNDNGQNDFYVYELKPHSFCNKRSNYIPKLYESTVLDTIQSDLEIESIDPRTSCVSEDKLPGAFLGDQVNINEDNQSPVIVSDEEIITIDKDVLISFNEGLHEEIKIFEKLTREIGDLKKFFQEQVMIKDKAQNKGSNNHIESESVSLKKAECKLGPATNETLLSQQNTENSIILNENDQLQIKANNTIENLLNDLRCEFSRDSNKVFENQKSSNNVFDKNHDSSSKCISSLIASECLSSTTANMMSKPNNFVVLEVMAMQDLNDDVNNYIANKDKQADVSNDALLVAPRTSSEGFLNNGYEPHFIVLKTIQSQNQNKESTIKERQEAAVSGCAISDNTFKNSQPDQYKTQSSLDSTLETGPNEFEIINVEATSDTPDNLGANNNVQIISVGANNLDDIVTKSFLNEIIVLNCAVTSRIPDTVISINEKVPKSLNITSSNNTATSDINLHASYNKFNEGIEEHVHKTHNNYDLCESTIETNTEGIISRVKQTASNSSQTPVRDDLISESVECAISKATTDVQTQPNCFQNLNIGTQYAASHVTKETSCKVHRMLSCNIFDAENLENATPGEKTSIKIKSDTFSNTDVEIKYAALNATKNTFGELNQPPTTSTNLELQYMPSNVNDEIEYVADRTQSITIALSESTKNIKSKTKFALPNVSLETNCNVSQTFINNLDCTGFDDSTNNQTLPVAPCIGSLTTEFTASYKIEKTDITALNATSKIECEAVQSQCSIIIDTSESTESDESNMQNNLSNIPNETEWNDNQTSDSNTSVTDNLESAVLKENTSIVQTCLDTFSNTSLETKSEISNAPKEIDYEPNDPLSNTINLKAQLIESNSVNTKDLKADQSPSSIITACKTIETSKSKTTLNGSQQTIGNEHQILASNVTLNANEVEGSSIVSSESSVENIESKTQYLTSNVPHETNGNEHQMFDYNIFVSNSLQSAAFNDCFNNIQAKPDTFSNDSLETHYVIPNAINEVDYELYIPPSSNIDLKTEFMAANTTNEIDCKTDQSPCSVVKVSDSVERVKSKMQCVPSSASQETNWNTFVNAYLKSATFKRNINKNRSASNTFSNDSLETQGAAFNETKDLDNSLVQPPKTTKDLETQLLATDDSDEIVYDADQLPSSVVNGSESAKSFESKRNIVPNVEAQSTMPNTAILTELDENNNLIDSLSNLPEDNLSALVSKDMLKEFQEKQSEERTNYELNHTLQMPSKSIFFESESNITPSSEPILLEDSESERNDIGKTCPNASCTNSDIVVTLLNLFRDSQSLTSDLSVSSETRDNFHRRSDIIINSNSRKADIDLDVTILPEVVSESKHKLSNTPDSVDCEEAQSSSDFQTLNKNSAHKFSSTSNIQRFCPEKENFDRQMGSKLAEEKNEGEINIKRNADNDSVDGDSKTKKNESEELNKTYLNVEKDIITMMQELLKESKDIKETVVLNGAEEDKTPPFVCSEINEEKAEDVCKLVVLDIFDMVFDTSIRQQRISLDDIKCEDYDKEKAETTCLDASNKKPSGDATIEIKVSENILGEKNCTTVSELGPIEHNKFLANKQTVYFCSPVSTNKIASRIPKTSWSFGEKNIHQEIRKLPIVTVKNNSTTRKYLMSKGDDKLLDSLEKCSDLFMHLFGELCCHSPVPPLNTKHNEIVANKTCREGACDTPPKDESSTTNTETRPIIHKNQKVFDLRQPASESNEAETSGTHNRTTDEEEYLEDHILTTRPISDSDECYSKAMKRIVSPISSKYSNRTRYSHVSSSSSSDNTSRTSMKIRKSKHIEIKRSDSGQLAVLKKQNPDPKVWKSVIQNLSLTSSTDLDFSTPNLNSNHDLTESGYDCDYDYFPLPEPKHKYQSSHELNSPEEIEAIEFNVIANDLLERKTPIVLNKVPTGRTLPVIQSLASSETSPNEISSENK